jgi:hypothetical protein
MGLLYLYLYLYLHLLYKQYDERDVVKFIKPGRLRWAGHVMRIEESDPAMKVLCTKQGGNGDRRGSPKLRWRDVLQEGVSKGWCRNWGINPYPANV